MLLNLVANVDGDSLKGRNFASQKVNLVFRLILDFVTSSGAVHFNAMAKTRQAIGAVRTDYSVRHNHAKDFASSLARCKRYRATVSMRFQRHTQQGANRTAAEPHDASTDCLCNGLGLT